MVIDDYRFNAVTIAVTSSGTSRNTHVALVIPVTVQPFDDRRYDGNAVDRT